MMSTQPPFLAPCLQSSNRSNDDPDLSYNLGHSQCCQKHQKYLRRAASISELLAGKILINSHSGVRGERRAKWRDGDSLGCAGWLLELTLPGDTREKTAEASLGSRPELSRDCWRQSVLSASCDQGSVYKLL